MTFSRWWRQQSKAFAFAVERQKARWAIGRHRRRIEKEERLRHAEITGGTSSLSAGWQRFSIRRRLQRERLAIWWVQTCCRYKTIHWLAQRQHLLFWAFVIALVGIFFAYITLESRKVQPGVGPVNYEGRVAATINGRPIPLAEMAATLETTYGAEILQKLAEQEVVRQEAERLNIRITAQESGQIDAILAQDPLRTIHGPELRTQVLLRKLALLKATKERKRQVYNDFKDDLRLYSLSGFRFKTRDQGASFLKSVEGGMVVNDAAEKFAIDGIKPLDLGTLTVAQIRQKFGRAASDAIEGQAKGYLTRPLQAQGGFAIYQVTRVETSFEKVEVAIDDLITQAEATQVLYDLMSKAKIESPFLETRKSVAPAPSASPHES